MVAYLNVVESYWRTQCTARSDNFHCTIEKILCNDVKTKSKCQKGAPNIKSTRNVWHSPKRAVGTEWKLHKNHYILKLPWALEEQKANATAWNGIFGSHVDRE